MKIIDNINGSHNNSIQSMFYDADSMILVSPFLTEDFEEFIHDLAKVGVENISLITTIKDNSPDLFKKANSLYSFCSSCLLNNIKYEVRVDNKLHGKIYIALNSDEPLRGIISSANFTDNGLSYSHEWGVEIDDSVMLQKIISDLVKVTSSPLSYNEIETIIKTIDEYSKQNPLVQDQQLKLEVTKHFENRIIENNMSNLPEVGFSSETRYFLKPVGSSDEPFDERRKLSTTIQDMHFSKRKPNAVRIGDILICYGVGTTKLLGYFRVLSEPYRLQDENSRWPWQVNTENICPKYSINWSLYNNTLSSVQAAYGYDKELTFVGGKSLGALNFGADKIRLNKNFAHHIIDIIEQQVK